MLYRCQSWSQSIQICIQISHMWRTRHRSQAPLCQSTLNCNIQSHKRCMLDRIQGLFRSIQNCKFQLHTWRMLGRIQRWSHCIQNCRSLLHMGDSPCKIQER